MYQVVFCARLAFLVGCHTMILTNSSGGCIPNQKPGSVVILKDYVRDVNYHVLNHSANDVMFGRRHLPGTKTIDQGLAKILGQVAEQVNFPYYFGTYWYVMGPTYETGSQVQHIIKLGGSCVGMSTVPSILACANIGLRTCCLALCTNVAAGLSDEPLNHSVVVREANLAKKGFGAYVEKCILSIPDPGVNSSTFQLKLNERINYITENNNGIVWDSELYKRVNLGTYKDIYKDIIYIRSFLGNLLEINVGFGGKDTSSIKDNKDSKKLLIANREGPIPIWLLHHPFTMNVRHFECPIAFPLKTLINGWTKIAVSSSAQEAVLYFMLDSNKNLIVVLQGLQLEGLAFSEANYVINLLYGVIGHKNLYFMNVFTAFDTKNIYDKEEKDSYFDNNDDVDFKDSGTSTVISNKFALVKDWVDFEGGHARYPWPLFPPTDENADDTKVMFKYGFFGDFDSPSFSHCGEFIAKHFV